MSEEKKEVREAIIKALSKRIAEKIKKDYQVSYYIDKNGKVFAEINNLSKNVADAMEYLIRELAEKRFMYGLEAKKEPEDW